MDLFLSSGAASFGVPALVGTAIFLLRLVLMVSGGDADGIGDMDGGGGDIGDFESGDDPGAAFEILSFQALSAFAMGFGWGGLAALRGTGWEMGPSILVGIGCGALMVWLLYLMFRAMHALQSSGNVSIADTVGRTGEVYVRVPGENGGSGRVLIVSHGRQRLYSARTEGAEILRAATVRVVRANPDNTLTVESA